MFSPLTKLFFFYQRQR